MKRRDSLRHCRNRSVKQGCNGDCETEFSKGRVQMKKKKRIYNWIMAGAVLLMAGAGVMIAGNLQGWFDRDSGTKTEALADGGQVEVPEDAVVVVSEKTGDVNFERPGIAY